MSHPYRPPFVNAEQAIEKSLRPLTLDEIDARDEAVWAEADRTIALLEALAKSYDEEDDAAVSPDAGIDDTHCECGLDHRPRR